MESRFGRKPPTKVWKFWGKGSPPVLTRTRSAYSTSGQGSIRRSKRSSHDPLPLFLGRPNSGGLQHSYDRSLPKEYSTEFNAAWLQRLYEYGYFQVNHPLYPSQPSPSCLASYHVRSRIMEGLWFSWVQNTEEETASCSLFSSCHWLEVKTCSLFPHPKKNLKIKANNQRHTNYYTKHRE